MLEFRDDFFLPEIREGFFVDETMKRLWAAELEVLQTVATVCNKYGLTWYAAFGTLLGAIRHEGYVPWDDDMDIIMLREDYMKLLDVLEEELPEGFRVRSPFSKEGYTEYHTCVINGSGISIAPVFLERFHNCPFTVGLDIFPMDYLTDNEEERKHQVNLFKVAGRITQLGKNIMELDEIEGDDKDKSNDDFIEEMLQGIEYLEETCGVAFDYSLLETGQWEAIVSWAWKLANQIVMAFGDENSKYVSMFGDYVTNDRKKYPKEWFQEVYSATFEEFMIPIPCGYDEFLTTVYGDYHVRVKGGGMHEYPYYARQLRELREYVKKAEAEYVQAGLMEKKEETIPNRWLEIMEGKKTVVFMTGLPLFAEYGEKAIDKLEKSLTIFKEAKDRIALWWRPQAQMRTLLGLISGDLVERYDRIINTYIQEDWGILDQTDEENRVAEMCDAYYGEMNYIANLMKNAGKPVMIERMTE